jgi:hypothetical protein
MNGGYWMCEADLRNVADVECALRDSDIDFGAPTLVVSECVLIYMKAGECLYAHVYVCMYVC